MFSILYLVNRISQAMFLKIDAAGFAGLAMTASIEHRLIILEFAQPVGPVVGGAAAGPGPGAGDVEALVPLQRPELLQADLACGPVAKDRVLESAVAIDADPLHLLGVDGAGNGSRSAGRRVGMAGPGIDPPHAGEHGDVVGLLDVGGAPVVGGGASAPHAVEARRDVAHPAVRPVAADVVVGGSAGARLPGVPDPATDIAGRGGFGRFRADADLLLDGVELGDGAEPPAAAALAGDAPGLFLDALQGGHEDREQ